MRPSSSQAINPPVWAKPGSIITSRDAGESMVEDESASFLHQAGTRRIAPFSLGFRIHSA